MKETTVLNRISKLVESIDYKSVYIDIETKTDRYTLEKNNRNKIGFDTGGDYEYKSEHK